MPRWQRRQNRRQESRTQLRCAYEAFSRFGADGFAERARRELLSTGETVSKRTVGALAELTSQETQIARLARDGHTNPEIAAQLFISPRTVEWHLGNIHQARSQLSQTPPLSADSSETGDADGVSSSGCPGVCSSLSTALIAS